MSPYITPISTLNLQTRYNTLSKYAQRFMKFQVKSISFELERFLGSINPDLVAQNEQNLKKAGIKKIGKDLKEGIIIAGEEYDYRIFSSKENLMSFDMLKPDSNLVCRRFNLNSQSDEYTYAGEFNNSSIEDEMSEILDFVSSKLIKAKRECSSAVTPEPFIANQETSEKVAECNRELQSLQKNTDIKNAGFIETSEEDLIKTVLEKLQIIREMYKKIPDMSIRYDVRSAYKNYMPQPVANKLGFKDIGPNFESISLFYTTYKNISHTIIAVTNLLGKEKMFVISNDKGSVQKNLPYIFVKSKNTEKIDRRIHMTPDYYTQNELDESNLYTYLDCLNREMDNFIEYTQNWFDAKAELKRIRSNYDTATLDQYKDLLDDILSSFKTYKAKMKKYLNTKIHKVRKFKTENNISTKFTSTAVKFDNITPEGDDLRLSYPKIRDKNAMQIIVMRGDEIKNSFYILDNKLLRFKIKTLNDMFNHYDQNMYFYDNKYLQESNLYSYLILLRDKLYDLNAKLDIIREKQIENRIKYNLKTPKNDSI